MAASQHWTCIDCKDGLIRGWDEAPIATPVSTNVKNKYPVASIVAIFENIFQYEYDANCEACGGSESESHDSHDEEYNLNNEGPLECVEGDFGFIFVNGEHVNTQCDETEARLRRRSKHKRCAERFRKVGGLLKGGLKRFRPRKRMNKERKYTNCSDEQAKEMVGEPKMCHKDYVGPNVEVIKAMMSLCEKCRLKGVEWVPTNSKKLEDEAFVIVDSGTQDMKHIEEGEKQESNVSLLNANDVESFNTTVQVMLLGSPNSGKTSLLHRLIYGEVLGILPKPEGSSQLGVDELEWSNADSDVTFKSLDFTGPEDGSLVGLQNGFLSIRNVVYLLLWDCGVHNDITYYKSGVHHYGSPSKQKKEEERANVELKRDFDEKVKCWVERVAFHTKDMNATIIPVLTFQDKFQAWDLERRCCLFQKWWSELQVSHSNVSLSCRNYPAVISNLTLHQIASVRNQLVEASYKQPIYGKYVPNVTKKVKKIISILKSLRTEFMCVGELKRKIENMEGMLVTEVELGDSLDFLESTGEIRIIPACWCTNSEVRKISEHVTFDPKSIVIMNPKFLVKALMCIFQSVDNAMSNTSSSSTLNTNCPLTSKEELISMWNSKAFMWDALVKSGLSPTNYDFLVNFFEVSGFLVPLKQVNKDTRNYCHLQGQQELLDKSYFLPSKLDDTAPSYSFRTRNSWQIVLAQSYHLCPSSNIMERILSRLLQDLCNAFPTLPSSFLCEKNGSIITKSKVRTVSAGLRGEETIEICEFMFWKTAMYIKFFVFSEGANPEFEPRFIEVLADFQQSSSYNGKPTSLLTLSAKGPNVDNGNDIWRSGFKLIADSVDHALEKMKNVIQKNVHCPECLSNMTLKESYTWKWETISAASNRMEPSICCRHSHNVCLDYLTSKYSETSMLHNDNPDCHMVVQPMKKVVDLYNGVVLVGSWDRSRKKLKNMGSGFVVNAATGVIVTAAHIFWPNLYGMLGDSSADENDSFADENSDIVIGVIPRCKCSKKCGNYVKCKPGKAVFRYFAEVSARDLSKDICALQIRTKFEQDVEGNVTEIGEVPEKICLKYDKSAMKREKLQKLKLAEAYELGELIRVLGYRQVGHPFTCTSFDVNRGVEFCRGHLLSDPTYEFLTDIYKPRQELMISCRTFNGQSGGPCVNQRGEVVGILCRSYCDKSFLVPLKEIKDIVEKARECRRDPYNYLLNND